MNAQPNQPKQQQNTEWHGEVQRFSGPAVSPDDPSLEPRVRRGRPAATQRETVSESDERTGEEMPSDPMDPTT